MKSLLLHMSSKCFSRPIQGSSMPAEALTNKKIKELGKVSCKAFPSGSNQILLITEQLRRNTPSLDNYQKCGVMAKADLFFMVSVGTGLLALCVTGNFSGPSVSIVGFCNSIPALSTAAVFLEPQVTNM